MSEGRRFDPAEIDVELGPEGAELLATARDLESYAATGLAAPTVGFEDRVMAAIADEPMPRPAGRGFVATVRDAWAIAFGPGRPVAIRAQAFAMLLALAVAVGSVGSVAVVGAARLLGDQGPVPPTVPSPSPSPRPSPSIVSPTPSPSISPSPTPPPSPSASPVETETPEPSGTDDHGGGSGNSGPGGGGGSDDSGGSSGSSRSGSSGRSSDDSSKSGSGHD
jgi:uncharacterized membrane protein YgcG